MAVVLATFLSMQGASEVFGSTLGGSSQTYQQIQAVFAEEAISGGLTEFLRSFSPFDSIHVRAEGGYIMGNSIKEKDVLTIKAGIKNQHMEVFPLNRRANIAVQAACAYLLSNKFHQLRTLLVQSRVKPADIDRVVDILLSPNIKFLYFQSSQSTFPLFKRFDSEWYYLGDNGALDVDVIYFLLKRELEGAGNHLLEEYILHEVLENISSLGRNAKERHNNIIILTQKLFERSPHQKQKVPRGQTPLGKVLREFIKTEQDKIVIPNAPIVRTGKEALLWGMLVRMLLIPDNEPILLEDKYQLLLAIVPDGLSSEERHRRVMGALESDLDMAISIDLMIAHFKPSVDPDIQDKNTKRMGRKFLILKERPELWFDAILSRGETYKDKDYLADFLKSVPVISRYLLSLIRSEIRALDRAA